MRRVTTLLAALAAALLLPAAGQGQGPSWDGFVSADKRYLVSDGVDNGDTFGKARLELSGALTADTYALASVELRYYDLPALEALPETEETESAYPVDPLLWEAYLALDRFIWPDLDVRLGKQRIAWGRADQFNPTDNLNPDDLTDFFDFGAKVPSWAVQGTWYAGESELTAVWLPFVQPALLPRGGTAALLGGAAARVERPERTPGNSMYALKFSGYAFNVDYSLSYFDGFDDLPVLVPEPGGPVLRFPSLKVIGFDFAGEFRAIGFRGEAAQFRPEEVTSDGAVALPGEPYVKYTVGLDYTFRGGLFLEAQLVHGFTTERGAGELGDFLVVTAEQSFLNDELELSLSAAVEARDGSSLGDPSGTAFFPEITYALPGNVELGGGAYLLEGEDGSLFGRFREQDQVFLKTTCSF